MFIRFCFLLSRELSAVFCQETPVFFHSAKHGLLKTKTDRQKLKGIPQGVSVESGLNLCVFLLPVF